MWRRRHGPAYLPIQRPLAPWWVILSRQIVAYYGLIRSSGTLPAVSCNISRVFAFRARSRTSPLLSACPSSVPSSLPGGSAECDCFSPSALAFTILSSGSASRDVHAKVRLTHGDVFERQSSLHATARQVARPAPTRAFTLELSCRRSPYPHVQHDYAGTQSIPRPVLHRLDKQPCGLHDRPSQAEQESSPTDNPK